MSEYTPWFRHEVKPLRVGVYQVRTVSAGYLDHGFAHWDGRSWSWAFETVEAAAARNPCRRGAYQAKEWRGLTEPAKV